MTEVYLSQNRNERAGAAARVFRRKPEKIAENKLRLGSNTGRR